MNLGIDVATASIHCVTLAHDGRVDEARVFGAAELVELVAWAGAVDTIAIDAPDRLSIGAHENDPEPLGRKFRRGRCAEVALGRRHGVWVPWVTPAEAPPPWMATGLEVYEVFRAAGRQPIEVYPYAAFLALAAGPLPRKTTLPGARRRIALLRRAGVHEARLEAWSHDALDALVAAVVARDRAAGKALEVGCGHDGSAIWLPATLDREA